MAERKIIFVNRVYWPDESATAQLLADLAPALARKGRAVHIVTGGDGPAVHDGVTVHRTGGSNTVAGTFDRLGSYARFIRGARRELARLVSPGDLVVLKTDPPMLSAFATGLAVKRGALVCQWVQDIYPEIVSAHQGAWLAPLLVPLRVWRDAAWRRSARCVVVGTDMLLPVRAAGVAPGRVRHLPNWAPRELEQPAGEEELRQIRREWQVEDKFVVLYSGNLGRVHEFATGLDAATRLRDDPGIVFVFVGGGPRLAEVKTAAQTAGLTNVRFFPATPRARLAAGLAAAEAHLVTLRPGFETLVFPSKLAGILASGRPALFVGARHCGLARFVATERCGIAIATGDGDGLAQALSRLRADSSARAESGAAARAAYERHFRFAAAVENWDRLLHEIAAGESTLP